MNQIIVYIKFLWKSKNEHGIHSPFVYDLVTKSFYDKKNYQEYEVLKAYRLSLLSNKNFIEVTDFGAGSRVFKSNKRQISKIAKTAGISSKRAKLFFRLVNYFQPNDILEIGTSLGLATSALSLGSLNSKITTLEGCSNTIKIAKESLEVLSLEFRGSKEVSCSRFQVSSFEEVSSFKFQVSSSLDNENHISFINCKFEDYLRQLNLKTISEKPTTNNLQPTTHNQQPTTQNPQPTTHNSQLTTHNPQPTTHNPQPTTHIPQLTNLIYFDGNHSKEATLKYFELLLTTVNNNSVWIFDDIHWSKDMESAWEIIKSHPLVKVTIDTFQWGVVFFREEQVKEHFVVRV